MCSIKSVSNIRPFTVVAGWVAEQEEEFRS